MWQLGEGWQLQGKVQRKILCGGSVAIPQAYALTAAMNGEQALLCGSSPRYARGTTLHRLSQVTKCFFIFDLLTMNKGSKMKPGWGCILKNEEMLLVQIRNISSVKKSQGCSTCHGKHQATSVRHSNNFGHSIKCGWQAVQKWLCRTTEFNYELFDATKHTIIS